MTHPPEQAQNKPHLDYSKNEIISYLDDLVKRGVASDMEMRCLQELEDLRTQLAEKEKGFNFYRGQHEIECVKNMKLTEQLEAIRKQTELAKNIAGVFSKMNPKGDKFEEGMKAMARQIFLAFYPTTAEGERKIVYCAEGHRCTVPNDAISDGVGASHSCPVCGLGVPKEKTGDQHHGLRPVNATKDGERNAP